MSALVSIKDPQVFAEKMEEIGKIKDVEGRHGEADDLMCELLRLLGYDKGVSTFEHMNKLYA